MGSRMYPFSIPFPRAVGGLAPDPGAEGGMGGSLGL